MNCQHSVKKIVLGTAQLGMNYGIANTTGMPDQKAANAIVDAALCGGIREFDTAQGYGKSEEVLGKALAKHPMKNKAKIISKLSPTLTDCSAISIRSSIQKSLDKLGVDRLYALLLHREEHLDFLSQGLADSLSAMVQEGLVEHLGVSVYSPQKALEALDIEDIEFIQLPTNILDNRFVEAGIFEKAQNQGKTIYIRSVFLQGLLLMENVPEKMGFAAQTHAAFRALAREFEISPEEFALMYVQKAFPASKILCGADTPEQVTQNIQSWMKIREPVDIGYIRNKIGNVPERILNPSLW
jgi:aryl-alcohol dehydrogenase-like predicted oxidoreductase